MTKTLGTALALTAATLFLNGCAKNTADSRSPSMSDKVKCMGVNECKGQGLCDTATHDCAGKNECKGKGWIKVARSECETNGGTVL